MLRVEIDWLSSAVLPPSPCPAFQCLLAGHLRLAQALFTCERVDKSIGEGGGGVRGCGSKGKGMSLPWSGVCVCVCVCVRA